MDIKDLTREALADWLAPHGMEAYRADQVFKWVYLRQADHFEQMTDLAKPLRSLLIAHFVIQRLPVADIRISQDGSRKFLFALEDGHHIETVLIPEKDHYTLCISSQVGCAQGCRFCMTAKGGWIRNLRMGEIIAQVRDVLQMIPSDDPRRLTNVVLMGMGEPLANYENVVNALGVITDGSAGLKISSRRVTLSTAGVVPMLYRIGHVTDAGIAISLNAADDKTRDLIMPINRKYPLETLIEACRSYPLRPRRRITVEYILMKGVNDSPKDADNLVRLLHPIRSKVNLIPFNEYEGCEFRRPDPSTVSNFQSVLISRLYTAVVRYSKGGDIGAACGQLRAQKRESSE